MTTGIDLCLRMRQDRRMGNWTQVGENLVRHWAGNIYLRAKVSGKVIRVSLETDDLRIAKMKRDDTLAGLRKAAANDHQTGTVRSIGDVVNLVSKQVLIQPNLEPATISYYKEMFGILRATLPVSALVRSWKPADAAAWWKVVAKKYSGQRANNVLGMAKRVGKVMTKIGLRIDDPTAALKRVKMDGKELMIPSRQMIESIIGDIRGQRKSHSKESANYVAFLAFAGCRIGQARAFEWRHVEKDWIVFPSGVHGSKGAATRKLPISAPLRALLDGMRPDHAKGPLFHMKRPHEALKNSCVRLKIPHLRIHDLRHFFASHALESGVDVPTVARWLGHKDGGVLVLRTYGHVRDDHSLAAVKKLA